MEVRRKGRFSLRMQAESAVCGERGVTLESLHLYSQKQPIAPIKRRRESPHMHEAKVYW